MSANSILLIEDNPSDVGLTERALKKSNITNPLVVAGDGQEGLDYLFCEGVHAGRADRAPPVLVLLDLKLPRLDGLDVLRRIRADPRSHRVPVVILTSSREDQDIAAGYDLGVNSYIRKPVDFHQFADVIRQIGLYWLVINESPHGT